MKKTEAIHLYLQQSGWLNVTHSDHVSFLAAGEYNENYLVEAEEGRFVLRINHDSQLGLGTAQIEYEFGVLKALSHSGVTPKPFHVDPAAPGIGPVLLMEYIKGGPFVYQKHLDIAARIFAQVHGQPVSSDLLVQADPVLDIAEESFGLFMRHEDHPMVQVRERLNSYHDEILQLHKDTEGEFADEEMVIVNTEVNSGNFIVYDGQGWLVDWEKAVVSYRYQDLAHFLVPTTTLWKSDQRISPQERERFLVTYKEEAGLDLSLETLSRRTAILERTIVLRALSWCYMAYYEYTKPGRELRSKDTFASIRWYLDEIECFLQ